MIEDIGLSIQVSTVQLPEGCQNRLTIQIDVTLKGKEHFGQL